MVVRVVLQEVRVYVQLGIQVEAAQVKHLTQSHLPKMHGLLGRTRVHVFNAVHQRIGIFLGHQIGFANENLVRKAYLAARLLAVIELYLCMFGINQRQDGVQ